MKVAFITPCVSRLAGGIFEIERRLAQSLHKMPETAVEVFGAADEFTAADAPLWAPVPLNSFPFVGPAGMRWSSKLTRSFCRNDADIAHLHALWMHTSLVVRKWSRLRQRPYLTTLNGMLEPWALANSTWKKKLTGVLYEHDCLRRAGCLQANSVGESRSAREFGLTNPIAIIPNGVDLPQSIDAPAPWSGVLSGRRKVLLYLGRLHPKKGLVGLLRAWATCRPADAVLAVAGWDQGGHEAELKRLCDELTLRRVDFSGTAQYPNDEALLSADVIFLGPQYGEGKSGCLSHCDALALPSFSEGLPMVVLEAWAHGRPVLMTPGCNLPEGFSANAALEVQPEPASLADGLKSLLGVSSEERRAMGERGLALVRDRFTWPRVAAQLREVYAWMLGGGTRPACVVAD